MKTNLTHKISLYSTFATVFLLSKSLSAEAVYTDIDPDTMLAEDNDYYLIDMDNNGVPDFKIQKISGSFYSYWSEHLSYAYYVFMGPWLSGNRIAAIKSVIDKSYGGFTQYFPFALNSGQLIDEDLTFQNNNFEVLAYIINSDGGASQAIGGQWLDGQENMFLGVKFKDSLDCFHYGWIRCSSEPDAASLTIHDYAYETKCATGIYAGDTIGDTTTVASAELAFNIPTVYNYSDNIIINIDLSLLGAHYSIISLDGKVISSGNLDVLNNTFNIVAEKGNYIVTVRKGDDKYSKQILVVQ